MRQIKIAALNVAMHQPHSPTRYVTLIRTAYRLRRPIRLGALHGAMLGALYGENAEVPTELSGEIYRFVHLDPSEPWFNTRTRDQASEQEVQEINIPGHLLPHLQRIAFVFRPKSHQLLFISLDRKDRMGAATAVTFFQRLFDEVRKTSDFPPVDVTAIADKDNLVEMLSLPVLERLTIELKRPNPDDAGGERARWMKKLQKQNAQTLKTELVAVKGESIKPDEDTRSAAHVAADNGNVRVVGRNAGGTRVEESTKDRPLLITATVDDNVETATQVLSRTQI